MKILGLLLIAGVFVVTPMVLLSTVLMPEIENMQYTYSHLDEIAAKSVE